MPLRRIPGPGGPPAPSHPFGATRTSDPHRPRRRGIAIGVGALAIAAGIGFAPLIPTLDGVGAAWTSFLPWTAVLLVLLGIVAVIRRAWWGLAGVIAAALVWSVTFVPQLTPERAATRVTDLTVASQNVGGSDADAVAAVRSLTTTGAGLVAVQELSGSAGDDAAAVLDARYPYHARVGTVGLWSQWPLGPVTPLELGFDWARGLQLTVRHDQGDITALVVHLPSVRPGNTAARDQAIGQLHDRVAADPAGRVLVIGDLNTAATDPLFASLTGQLTDSRESVGGGFGFTWPASFPMTRPDHVLSRGMTVLTDQVLAADGSDHRPVVAGFSLHG